MLSGFAKNRKFCDVVDVIEAVPEKNVVSYNAMLSGYLGIGDFMSAHKMFDEMGERNVVSWNAMIDEYVKGEWMLRLITGRPWPSEFGQVPLLSKLQAPILLLMLQIVAQFLFALSIPSNKQTLLLSTFKDRVVTNSLASISCRTDLNSHSDC
ncbi:hypothetical protein FXO38_13868 [Capsicum annuum]|uniref:Pentatricopeptide repeat-containing protein n=1 Tax=Capsicum annuum TaxID=4072 RepID=A0A2G3A512_CAPAN|nr:hypothetical protein FXO37_29653 [Capsicum annuum]KAF3657053.1 hypothetical protein FXO38_13868 [Capsicum annuum]PHT89336.1 hypothetical protein T459_04449 [Capsicum annuum]